MLLLGGGLTICPNVPVFLKKEDAEAEMQIIKQDHKNTVQEQNEFNKEMGMISRMYDTSYLLKIEEIDIK